MEGTGAAEVLGSRILTAAGWKRAVDLLHDLGEVRAGVVGRGQQVLGRCNGRGKEQAS